MTDLDGLVLDLIRSAGGLSAESITAELNVLDRVGALEDFHGIIGNSETLKVLRRLSAAGRVAEAGGIWQWMPERSIVTTGASKQRSLLDD